ncbi:DNA-processing protein DprA [Malikia spinosa]|nr:DNA-processing protein DprA [Malikia spinosa]
MNKQDLSEDTEVVLLLCGRFGGEKQEPHQPLSPREYSELAKWLNACNLRPSDLMTDAGRDALSSLQVARLESKRVEFLLGRGTAMALALERWARGGLWVISRGDMDYPKRLKRQLKHAAPPLLYGAGDKTLLEKGGLAIIGSRDASESALSYTRSIAARCAHEGLAVVSGGARGVDAAAMQGATEAGGYCIGVLANDLLKTSVNRQNRIGLQEGCLVLVSPFFPEAGFSAGNAMGRNRYIYTLADQALVIDSALRSGGTWEGAVENLKNGWVPLYVRTPGEGPGNVALVADGGLPFTLTADSTDSLVDLFASRPVDDVQSGSDIVETQQLLLVPEAMVTAEAVTAEIPSEPVQEKSQPLVSPEALASSPAPQPATATEVLAPSEAHASGDAVGTVEEPAMAEQPAQLLSCLSLDMYADFSAKLASLLGGGALSEEDIATQLCIEKSQAKAWLKRASEAGLVDKLKKPVRYALGRQGSLC